MSGETAPSGEIYLGEYYLALLGLGDRADEQIPGYQLQARNFLAICGEQALPALVAWEHMDPTIPEYEATRAALRSSVEQFLTPPANPEG